MVTVIVVYSIFITIYTSIKENGHYRLFDEKILKKKISYVRAWILNFVYGIAIVLPGIN